MEDKNLDNKRRVLIVATAQVLRKPRERFFAQLAITCLLII